MDDNHTRPISRGDLLFTIEMALHKAERYWPKKRVPGDNDRLKPAAQNVVEHMELCGMKCFGRPRGRGHSTPDPWGTGHTSSGEAPPEAEEDCSS